MTRLVLPRMAERYANTNMLLPGFCEMVCLSPTTKKCVCCKPVQQVCCHTVQRRRHKLPSLELKVDSWRADIFHKTSISETCIRCNTFTQPKLLSTSFLLSLFLILTSFQFTQIALLPYWLGGGSHGKVGANHSAGTFSAVWGPSFSVSPSLLRVAVLHHCSKKGR